MANQAWLESSLRRSASLGLEVLERASRRSVDWSSTGASQTSSSTDEDTQTPLKRAHSERDGVFAALAGLMAQTTYQCKRFYESGCCTEPTHTERNHVSRFHTRPAAGTTTSALSATIHGRSSSVADEDFYIEVSPGTSPSLPACRTRSIKLSWSASEPERALTSPLTFDPFHLTKPVTLNLQ